MTIRRISSVPDARLTRCPLLGRFGTKVGTSQLVILIAIATLLHVGIALGSGGTDNVSYSYNTITYEWSCTDINGSSQDFTLRINFPRGLQHMQKTYTEKSHEYVRDRARQFLYTDPFYADYYVVAEGLRDLSRYSSISIGEIAVSFVQSLPYQSYENYQRYGIETLIDGKGDCSDKSVLLGGILNALKLQWVFVHFPSHLAVALWCDHDWPGTYFEDLGRKYFFCETTSKRAVGSMRAEYENELATIERPWLSW